MDSKIQDGTMNCDFRNDVNVPTNYCLYQQRYPIRLPKLTEVFKSPVKDFSFDNHKANRKSTLTSVLFDEKKDMTRLKAAKNAVFAKRPMQESNQRQILKETERLQLEDFLEEDAVVEEPLIFPISTNGDTFVIRKGEISKPSVPKGKLTKTKVGYSYREDSVENFIAQFHHGPTQKNSKFIDIVGSKLFVKSNDSQNREYSVREHATPGRFLSSKLSNQRVPPKTRSFSDNKEIFLKPLKTETELSAIRSLTKNVKEKDCSTKPETTRPKTTERSKNRIMSSKISRKTGKHSNNENVPSKNTDGTPCDDVEKRKEKCAKLQEENEQKKEEIKIENDVCHDTPENNMVTISDEIKTKSLDQWSRQLDIDDEQLAALEDYSFVALSRRDDVDHLRGMPITFHTAKNLRLLMFGCVAQSFKESWREVNLVYYSSNHYALKFFKDSPAELMTALQAYVLKHLLFLSIETVKISDLAERLSPNEDTQQRCLVLAICDMIWKCGEKKHAIVALPTGVSSFVVDSIYYKEDQITEKMEFFKFTSNDDLEKFVRRNIRWFQQPNSHGCISLLYSLMLSRGLSNLKQFAKQLKRSCEKLFHRILKSDFQSERCGILEMKEDDPSFRSQMLVNLAISGAAVPNVFNRDVEVYNETDGKYECHKGISKRNEFGYLDYKEFVDSKKFQVGSCLKTPLYPIWIAKHDGRLCVLFCLKKDLLNDWKLERRFNLYHYEGIPRYVDVIDMDVKLTIDTIVPSIINPGGEEEEPSQLEETIKTKWNDAVIEWNGHARF